MDKSIFFNEISVPDFLKPHFEKADWYLLQKDLVNILNNEMPEQTLNSQIKDSVKINGKVYIGNNVTISEYVVIDGPVYIGDDVEIGPFTWIRPGSVISNGCALANHAHIKNSVMMEKSKIANHASLLDSILGSKARLAGLAETGNRRFDQQNIVIKMGEETLETGLDKYGSIIGEASRLGGGVFNSPGTLIGKNCFIASGAIIDGFIPADSFVKVKTELDIRENKFKGNLHNEAKFTS